MVIGEGDSRVNDKRFYCPFCSKPQSKLPRHLRTMHSNESEVAKYEMEQDKKKGDDDYKIKTFGKLPSNEMIKEDKGTLVVKYRSASDTSWLDYVPCYMCLGYYIHYDVWKHRKRCHLRIEGQKI